MDFVGPEVAIRQGTGVIRCCSLLEYTGWRQTGQILYPERLPLLAQKHRRKVEEASKDPNRWAKMALLNTASRGKFTSDRTIQEYVDNIWKLDDVTVKTRSIISQTSHTVYGRFYLCENTSDRQAILLPFLYYFRMWWLLILLNGRSSLAQDNGTSPYVTVKSDEKNRKNFAG